MQIGADGADGVEGGIGEWEAHSWGSPLWSEQNEGAMTHIPISPTRPAGPGASCLKRSRTPPTRLLVYLRVSWCSVTARLKVLLSATDKPKIMLNPGHASHRHRSIVSDT